MYSDGNPIGWNLGIFLDRLEKVSNNVLSGELFYTRSETWWVCYQHRPVRGAKLASKAQVLLRLSGCLFFWYYGFFPIPHIDYRIVLVSNNVAFCVKPRHQQNSELPKPISPLPAYNNFLFLGHLGWFKMGTKGKTLEARISVMCSYTALEGTFAKRGVDKAFDIYYIY
jgi:hypothetical protein